jgi:hypothetical protein
LIVLIDYAHLPATAKAVVRIDEVSSE